MKSLEHNNKYSCYYSRLDDKEFQKNTNTACWKGIQQWIADEIEIYIEDFERKETFAYVEDLVQRINKITPCSLITIDDKRYIKFKLINHYDKSLILLNFIRNLWSSPTIDYYKKDLNIKTSLCFFEELSKNNDEDEMINLTKANIKACAFYNSFGQRTNPWHSNILGHQYFNLMKPLSTKKFLTTKATEVVSILTLK